MASRDTSVNAPARLARRERVAFVIFLSGFVVLFGMVGYVVWVIASGELARIQREGIWVIGGPGNRTEIFFAVIGTVAAGCFYVGRRSAREIETHLAGRVNQEAARARSGDPSAVAAHQELWPIYLTVARRWWWMRLIGWLFWLPLIAAVSWGLWAVWKRPPEDDMRMIWLALLGFLLFTGLVRFLWLDRPGPKPGPR